MKFNSSFMGRFHRKKRLGQSMTEYAIISSVLIFGCFISTPVFSKMTNLLMMYLRSIQYVLNFPLP